MGGMVDVQMTTRSESEFLVEEPEMVGLLVSLGVGQVSVLVAQSLGQTLDDLLSLLASSDGLVFQVLEFEISHDVPADGKRKMRWIMLMMAIRYLVGMTWLWLTNLTKGLMAVLLVNFLLDILLLTDLGFLAIPTTRAWEYLRANKLSRLGHLRRDCRGLPSRLAVSDR